MKTRKKNSKPAAVKRKTTTIKTTKPKLRGFAAMSAEQKRRIASMGGKMVSKNRKHMAAIGAVGGAAPHKASRKAK